jgi:hypothetical protein
MCDTSWYEDATKAARTGQIIVGALVASTSAFLAVVLGIGPQVKPPALPQPISFTLIAFVFVGVGLIARAVVVWGITAKARREIVNGTYASVVPRQQIGLSPAEDGQRRDAKYLLAVFQQRTVVSAAMFEGWGFFATIAYMIEGGPASLALAVLLILGVAAHFPSRSRVIGWVEGQLNLVGREQADVVSRPQE